MNDLTEIRKLIEGEDVPDMVDLVVDIIPALCDEIEELRDNLDCRNSDEWDEADHDEEYSEEHRELLPNYPKTHTPARILAMCEGGHNRSGALALQLKQRGIDAIQIGWRHNTAATINHFAEWADFIIQMQPWGPETTKISKMYADKVRVLDVGPDVWGSNTHMELNKLVAPFVEDWIKRGWDI